MRGLARVLIRVFFRRVEIEWEDRVPAHGPVLVVANHTNGLVDGLLLMAMLRRFPRFLGKSTLFKIPPLWPFLKLAGVIPVYRAMDGTPTSRNTSAFATSERLLARESVVAIFPEGVSHDEASVQPLRTGAARIALDAAADGGTIPVVAVGLIYDDKSIFRSRALVRVGEPMWVSQGAGEGEAGRAAVRQLTESIARRLGEVSPPYSSWAQADELALVADVVVRPVGQGLHTDVALADRTATAERLATLDDQAHLQPTFAALRSAFAAYRRDLDLLGLTDGQVATRYASGALRRSVLRSLIKVVVAVPFAVLGFVVHVLPFQIVKQLAARSSNEGIKATIKLLGCFVLFFVTYVLVGVLVGRSFGAWWGLAAALASPLCGYVSVRLFERVRRIDGLLEGFHTMRERGTVIESVLVDRQRVVDAARVVLSSP